ncbi:MAG: hypothetical protein ACFFC7_27675 [Candidatus Hermodarchaeota archaeon]
MSKNSSNIPQINLKKVIKLKDSLSGLKRLDFPDSALIVENLEPEIVLELILEKARSFLVQAVSEGNASFQIPTRSSSNIIYDKGNTLLLQGKEVSDRSFRNLSSCLSVTQMASIMRIISEVLEKNRHLTKRDIYYMDKRLFGNDQGTSDSLIEDLALMLGVTRMSLRVIASAKGLVVGNVSFLEDGDPIDCRKVGRSKSITPALDTVKDFESDAEFVLVVEKDAVFQQLSDVRFYREVPCIIITGKGQPDLATRMFVHRLRYELGLPIFGLMDADPYGLDILRVYTMGSKSLSFETPKLAVTDMKWLGVLPSDISRFNLSPSVLLNMTDQDMKRGNDMKKEIFIQSRSRWIEEIDVMLKTKKKAEIEALTSRGLDFMTEEYLPEKLEQGLWY